jgi:hypothetical protein
MFDRMIPSPPAPGADVIARAVGALALAALAVIHVVDLPATLGRFRWSASGTSGSSPQRSWSAA